MVNSTTCIYMYTGMVNSKPYGCIIENQWRGFTALVIAGLLVDVLTILL